MCMPKEGTFIHFIRNEISLNYLPKQSAVVKMQIENGSQVWNDIYM